jgi:Cu/Ag efflux pump CusA
MEGAVLRLRPKLMTVVTTVASLLPLLWSSSTGSEILRPLAVPVLGGMVSIFFIFSSSLLSWWPGCMNPAPRPSPGL